MPIICTFRGIKIYINWDEHNPPHFHAYYAEYECSISIRDFEVMNGNMPKKQLNMILGWAALHQDELLDNWELAEKNRELFRIDPLR